MQAARRPAPAGHRGGSTSSQPATATGQRGRKEQPSGRRSTSGGSPGRPPGLRRDARSPILGWAAASAAVYGCRGAVNTSPAGPSSTIRPAYITTSRSQVEVSTERSWLIMTRPIPWSVTSRSTRRRIWAWTMTSRALVGASATTSRGEQAQQAQREGRLAAPGLAGDPYLLSGLDRQLDAPEGGHRPGGGPVGDAQVRDVQQAQGSTLTALGRAPASRGLRIDSSARPQR